MYHSRIASRSIPLIFLTNKKRTSTLKATFQVQRVNIFIVVGIVMLLITQAVLTNYLNTNTLRLQDLQKQEEVIKNDISTINAAILQVESLEKVQVRARELGMTPDANVVFLTTEDSSFAKN